jgi:hypothetical protein
MGEYHPLCTKLVIQPEITTISYLLTVAVNATTLECLTYEGIAKKTEPKARVYLATTKGRAKLQHANMPDPASLEFVS